MLIQLDALVRFAQGQEKVVLALGVVLFVYVGIRLGTGMPARAQLRAILRGGDDATERGDYQGLLSYAAEHHAAQHGLYDGLRSKRPLPGELPDNEDVQAEPHYYKGAYLVGTVAHLLLVGAVGLGGSSFF